MNTSTYVNGVTVLRKKFPGIILALNRIDAANGGATSVQERTQIWVERVHQDMLPNVAELCSGFGASLIDITRPEFLGWRHEVIFAVSAEHEILGQIGALAPKEELRDTTPLKFLLREHLESIEYVVRVNVTGWCHRLDHWMNQSTPLGELHSREIDVTVYREPDEGFKALLTQASTEESLRMHFFEYRPNDPSLKNPDVIQFLKRLDSLIEQFQMETFSNGFHESLALNSSEISGRVAGVFCGYSTWDGRDKVRVTFSKGAESIGLFYRADVQKLQLVSIDATLLQARELLAEVNLGWAIQRAG